MATAKRISAGVMAKRLAARLLDIPEDVAIVPEVDNLTAFKRHIYRRYEHALHLEALDWHLQQVTRYVETRGAEGIGRLIIAMPPRHGKSMTTSRLFPVWFLGRNPDKRVMLVSYGQSMAVKNSRFARNFMRSRLYRETFPSVGLSEDSQSVSEWNIAGDEGGADALGILGAATGKGAHLLVIDDPHKNRAEAESATIRNKVWDAYTNDLLTRLEPGGAIIVMATRWHEDDLTGRLLRQEPDEWTELKLAGLAGENDSLGRLKGEALWPERFSREALERIKASMGEYGWSALYDQEPRPSEGGIFKKAWFMPTVRTVPEVIKSVRFWDLAMSSKQSADYTVGLRMDLGRDGEWYITDVVREQVELHDLPALLIDTMLADGVHVRQGFEEAGYMTRAIQTVAKDTRVAAFDLRGYRADKDKFTRALPFAARAALGVVNIAVEPSGMRPSAAEALLEEFASFPNGSNDDQVDAAAGAWMMINEPDKRPVSVRVGDYA